MGRSRSGRHPQEARSPQRLRAWIRIPRALCSSRDPRGPTATLAPRTGPPRPPLSNSRRAPDRGLWLAAGPPASYHSLTPPWGSHSQVRPTEQGQFNRAHDEEQLELQGRFCRQRRPRTHLWHVADALRGIDSGQILARRALTHGHQEIRPLLLPLGLVRRTARRHGCQPVQGLRPVHAVHQVHHRQVREQQRLRPAGHDPARARASRT